MGRDQSARGDGATGEETAVRITLLVENTASGEGILGEHGLAIWIDVGGHRVLFDTGQGMLLETG